MRSIIIKTKKQLSRAGRPNIKPKEFQQCSKCVPDPAPKYAARPSPPCHAAECPDMVMRGNDGKVYVSKADKKGNYKWVAMTHTNNTRKAPVKNTYFTHDNGGRPFKVVISGKKLDIYEAEYVDFDLSRDYTDYRHYEHRLTVPVRRVLLGDDPENIYKNRPDDVKKWIGNSILAELTPTKYMYIGDSVYEFTTTGPITLFRSPVGNNDVPYSFAMDSKYVYLLIENAKVPRASIDMEQKPFNPYTQYYQFHPYNKGEPLPEQELGKKEIIQRQ